MEKDKSKYVGNCFAVLNENYIAVSGTIRGLKASVPLQYFFADIDISEAVHYIKEMTSFHWYFGTMKNVEVLRYASKI